MARDDEVGQLKFFLSRMSAVRFPGLQRPPERPGQPPSRDLVNWAIRAYVYSSLCHFRELLRSYLLLLANTRVPGCFVIARSLFELGAHSYYVHKHASQYIQSSDLNQAWTFLFEIGVGSRHMRDYGLKDLGMSDATEFPLSPHIAKAIAAFDEYGNLKLSKEEYSFLSEFAHPSVGAFSGYREIDEQESRFVFPEPAPILKNDPRSGSVLIAATTTCQYSGHLLSLSGDAAIGEELTKLLGDFLQRATRS
jgi:hypothetical protein